MRAFLCQPTLKEISSLIPNSACIFTISLSFHSIEMEADSIKKVHFSPDVDQDCLSDSSETSQTSLSPIIFYLS